MGSNFTLPTIILSVLFGYLLNHYNLNRSDIYKASYNNLLILSTNTSNVINTSTDTSLLISLPVLTNGVIFVSDGSKGYAREASIELSKHGYHVLVGCKSDLEIKTFAYDQRKGLELIKYDITSPSTLTDVIYRLRQIRRDLDRPLTGVILNIAEYIEDYSIEASAQLLDINYLDRHYKALFKGPTRLIQSLLELIKHQRLTAPSSSAAALSSLKETKLLLSSSSSSSSSSSTSSLPYTTNNQTESKRINTEALRITTLFSSYDGVAITHRCGTKCIMQDSFLKYLYMLSTSSDFEYHNFSIANIAMPAPSIYHNNQHGTTITSTNTTNSHHHNHHRVQSDLTIPINIASPKVEKEYDDSVLQWRLKNIESFLQSKIKWVLHDFKREDGSKPTGKNVIDDVDDDDLLHPPAATKRRKNKHRRPRDGDDNDNDNDNDDDKNKSKVDKYIRAILHSFLSTRPLLLYEEEK